MYIFELLTKLFSKKNKSYDEYLYNEQENILQDESFENPEECNHVFLPLDSSKEYFACKNCGIVIKAKDLL